VVLFPEVMLPLHIFEPRYRQMVRDAQENTPPLIGMALLRGNWQEQYEGRPEIFPICCVGEMVRVEPLQDGRFNILLKGLRECRITQELSGKMYREAVVEWRPSLKGVLPQDLRQELNRLLNTYLPKNESVQKFLADKDSDKRAKLIDKLLDDPSFARNLTTIWTNNLIGRATPRDINRPALQKFLRESFGRNRGWNEIVFDLLAAQGANNENGATNFLLAHLNDGAVPATAISAKLFLGMQVQCTQCHNHPFNEWKQNAFWEFNSFFKQARREDVRKYDEKTGRMVVDHLELNRMDFGGPIYFERRNGLMEVAYPKAFGTDVNPEADTNRRLELAKIITSGKRTQMADAAVNRMWGHFFGYGFTKPVDDMGVLSPSHPLLPERMSLEFVKAKTMTRESLNKKGMPARMARAIKKLHAGPRFLTDFNMFRLTEYYLQICTEHAISIPDGYAERMSTVTTIEQAMSVKPLPAVPCNNDLLAENYMDDGKKL
jgi:Lon protease-like protein